MWRMFFKKVCQHLKQRYIYFYLPHFAKWKPIILERLNNFSRLTQLPEYTLRSPGTSVDHTPRLEKKLRQGLWGQPEIPSNSVAFFLYSKHPRGSVGLWDHSVFALPHPYCNCLFQLEHLEIWEGRDVL